MCVSASSTRRDITRWPEGTKPRKGCSDVVRQNITRRPEDTFPLQCGVDFRDFVLQELTRHLCRAKPAGFMELHTKSNDPRDRHCGELRQVFHYILSQIHVCFIYSFVRFKYVHMLCLDLGYVLTIIFLPI